MQKSDQLPIDCAYEVFLSYSHRDKPFAVKLETALKRYRPPIGFKVGQRRLRVFRDDSEAKGGRLSEALQEALAASRTLVVICSPAARESEWVNREIESFTSYHGSKRIFPVLAEGMPNEEAVASGRTADAAFPPALLAAISDTPWAADFRRVSRSGSAVRRTRPAWFHLLAGVYNVKREEIEKRERTRNLLRAAVALIGAGAVLFSVLYVAIQTPSRSWMPSEIGSIICERAAVVSNQAGRQSIRAVTRKSGPVLRHYEGAVLDIVTVIEMNARGKLQGCFAYSVEEYQVAGFRPGDCEKYGGKGTMLDEWNYLEGIRQSGKYLGDLWPYFIRNSNKLFELDPDNSSWDFPSDEGLEYPAFPELDQATGRLNYLERGVMEAALAVSEHARKIRIFRINRNTYLGLVEIVAGHFSEDQGILPVLTIDGGDSWKAGKKNNQMDFKGIASISRASSDLKVLYAASFDNFDPHDLIGKKGGVFRSEDRGLSWEMVSGASSSDVGTLIDSPDVLAVALTPDSFKPPEIIMTEDLKKWVRLENGLPLRGRKQFKIIGIIGDLNVFIQHSGQLMEWRKLDWIERVQGRYGVTF